MQYIFYKHITNVCERKKMYRPRWSKDGLCAKCWPNGTRGRNPRSMSCTGFSKGRWFRHSVSIYWIIYIYIYLFQKIDLTFLNIYIFNKILLFFNKIINTLPFFWFSIFFHSNLSFWSFFLIYWIFVCKADRCFLSILFYLKNFFFFN